MIPEYTTHWTPMAEETDCYIDRATCMLHEETKSESESALLRLCDLF